jgi:glutamate-1-semialdehyde 2,1-aminomutase
MPRKLDECRRLQKRAEGLIPGGVNSPVRAFKAVECDAPFIVRGQGSHIWDADGNEYIDYVGSWGPLILGHAEPSVVEAILSAAVNGTSFGASTPAEADLAELIIEAFPTIQKVRFVSWSKPARASPLSAFRDRPACSKRSASSPSRFLLMTPKCSNRHSASIDT